MRNLFFVAVSFLLVIGLAEAASISLGVSWQISSNSTMPGGYSTIYLTVANTGTDVTGIVITPAAGPYLKIVSGSSVELGDMPAATTQQASVSVKADENAPSTVSYVFVEVTYYYSSSQYKKQLYVPVSIKRDPILQIENVNFSGSLEPGNKVLLSFDLVNQGLGDAKDIIASVSQSSNFIVSDSSGELFIDDLNKSESRKLSFSLTISPDASIGTTTIPLLLSYYDETRTDSYSETKSIGTSITGTYRFVVTAESQDVLAPETNGSITVKMANSGNEEALHLTINVLPPEGIDVNPRTIYVGNLKSDDYDSEKLSVDVGSTSTGSYPVGIQLTYEDLFGKSYNETYMVNAKVSSKEEYLSSHQASAPSDLVIVIVIIVAAAAFFAYRKWNLSKRK
jgi:hypothetical protein